MFVKVEYYKNYEPDKTEPIHDDTSKCYIKEEEIIKIDIKTVDFIPHKYDVYNRLELPYIKLKNGNGMLVKDITPFIGQSLSVNLDRDTTVQHTQLEIMERIGDRIEGKLRKIGETLYEITQQFIKNNETLKKLVDK